MRPTKNHGVSHCRRAKYELKHVVRTHLANNDAAFNCVVEQEDSEGVRGVKLSKELMAIAGGALIRMRIWCVSDPHQQSWMMRRGAEGEHDHAGPNFNQTCGTHSNCH
jgi:hypothetical protein